MDFSHYLFRCSEVGKLMSGVKPNLTLNQQKTLSGLISKKASGNITDKQLITLGDLIAKRDQKPKLSTGAISFLKEKHQEVVLGRSKVVETKYMDKGILCEEDSISLYQNVLDNKSFYIKNEGRFKNDFIIGTPDNVQDIVRDFKTSWDSTTFPMHDDKIPNNIYYWQLQSYMALTGLIKSELIYCLVDTPTDMIEDELRRKNWKYDIFDGNGNVRKNRIDLVVEVVSRMIYTKKGLNEFCHQSGSVDINWFTEFREIAAHHRVKIFPLEFDQKAIDQLYFYIELAREKLTEFTIKMVA